MRWKMKNMGLVHASTDAYWTVVLADEKRFKPAGQHFRRGKRSQFGRMDMESRIRAKIWYGAVENYVREKIYQCENNPCTA